MAMNGRFIRRALLAAAPALSLAAVVPAPASAADKTLKIGVLGVMSGPAASWGLTNKYCAEATANMYNAKGGVDIGGEKYKIEIVPIDDKNDPKLTVSGAERLTQQEGIKYIIGPNIDTTAASVRPVAEKNGALYFPYAFSKSLYTPPASNAVLGMIASYQAGPIIYKYLMENRGVKSVTFVARNESDALNQRKEGVEAAKEARPDRGLRRGYLRARHHRLLPGDVEGRGRQPRPDRAVRRRAGRCADPDPRRPRARLPGHAQHRDRPGHQDPERSRGRRRQRLHLGRRRQHARDPQPYMEDFAKEYAKVAGEWNDEAGTKVYALEIILATLQKTGKAAIDNVDAFKTAMPAFEMKNPFLKDEAKLTYVGTTDFGQKRQIGVPMVVNEVQDGQFKTLFVGSVE